MIRPAERQDRPRHHVFAAARPASAAIRPAQPTDLAALGEFFAGLSLRTRYLRFFAGVTPTGSMLRRLAGGGADVLVATDGGVIIGHAMAVDRAAPGRGSTADVGVVVADAWQGRGIGSALLRALIGRAQARGVAWLTMDVQHGNTLMRSVIARRWATAHPDYSSDCLTFCVPLPPLPRRWLPGRRPAGRRPRRAAPSRPAEGPLLFRTGKAWVAAGNRPAGGDRDGASGWRQVTGGMRPRPDKWVVGDRRRAEVATSESAMTDEVPWDAGGASWQRPSRH